jgi:hypothetical protein
VSKRRDENRVLELCLNPLVSPVVELIKDLAKAKFKICK